MMAYPVVAYKMCQNDITQQDLANRIGLSRPTLHKKLSGYRPLSDYEKFKIAKELGCEDMSKDILFINREDSRYLENAIQCRINLGDLFTAPGGTALYEAILSVANKLRFERESENND